MPIGTIVCAVCIVLGGFLGSALGERVREDTKDILTMIFGLCSMLIGVVSLPFLKNLPVVVLSVIVGTLIGRAIRLGDSVKSGLLKLTKGFCSEEYITIAVLFCVSGGGYYGALVEGVSGDHSILLAKAVMEFFTAMIFACSMKKSVALLGAPQLIVHLLIFFLARWIYPLCSEAMIADFKACGGLLTVAAGFRLLKLKNIPTADMIPSLVIVLPLSWFWTSIVIPMLG